MEKSPQCDGELDAQRAPKVTREWLWPHLGIAIPPSYLSYVCLV